jgi:hypothetical protein
MNKGTALLQYKQLCELPSANKVGLANLREVLDISGGHRGFPRDLENTIWSEENETDLTSLMDRYPKMDMCSRWIHSQLLHWYHNKLGHRLHDPISLAETSVQIPIIHYSDEKLTAAVDAISTILSSLLSDHHHINHSSLLHCPPPRIASCLRHHCSLSTKSM